MQSGQKYFILACKLLSVIHMGKLMNGKEKRVVERNSQKSFIYPERSYMRTLESINGNSIMYSHSLNYLKFHKTHEKLVALLLGYEGQNNAKKEQHAKRKPASTLNCQNPRKVYQIHRKNESDDSKEENVKNIVVFLNICKDKYEQ